jgi:hypothetical protein
MPGNAPVFGAENVPVNSNNVRNTDIKDALANALIGATTGGNVTKTRTRLVHNAQHQGRQVTEVQTLLNRNTTAQDVTNLKNEVIKKDRTLNFPADRSGNGGRAFNRT